jgi:hypothetical protein
MHHLKHIRKNSYGLIPVEKTWLKVMSLRNRKQIPVCRECHYNLIHRGKYGGTKLTQLAPKILWDNRLVTIESCIGSNPNKKEIKSCLIGKGWRIKQGNLRDITS